MGDNAKHLLPTDRAKLGVFSTHERRENYGVDRIPQLRQHWNWYQKINAAHFVSNGNCNAGETVQSYWHACERLALNA
jgi:hypothetical protein